MASRHTDNWLKLIVVFAENDGSLRIVGKSNLVSIICIQNGVCRASLCLFSKRLLLICKQEMEIYGFAN